MKKLVLATLLAAAFGAVQAQTVYGILDGGVRYDGSASNTGADKTAVVSGVQNTSRFGIKGSEDLGGGLSAKFQLESGFNITTGANSQQSATGSVLFDRLAFVGLSTSVGELQVGRNTNAPFDFATQGITDPLAQALDGVNAPVGTASVPYDPVMPYSFA